MMMQRSSSAPQPAALRDYRRRARDTSSPTGLIIPALSPRTSTTPRCQYRRCSSCLDGVPPRSASPEAAAGGESTSCTAFASVSPPTAIISEGQPMAQYSAPGPFELNAACAGMPRLPSPILSQETEVSELPRPQPPPAPSPRVDGGMPDDITGSSFPMEPLVSLPPAVETAQRPEREAQEQESMAAVLGAVSGTCMVCLEDRDDVLGPAWLHACRSKSVSPVAGGEEEQKDGEAHMKIEDCVVSACLACLGTYFTGIVHSGFDGACPRMRCMCCPRVVCERVWAPLVEPRVLDTFRTRAARLLSIQCGMCHTRGTIMVNPPAGHCYSLALDKLVAAIDSAVEDDTSGGETTSSATVSSFSNPGPADSTSTTPAASMPPAALAPVNITNRQDKEEASPSYSRHAKLKKAFLVTLERYSSGEEIDTSPCYLALEQVFCEPKIGVMSQEVRDDLMLLLMNCVEDSERRASLHIRFIRSYPMVVTRCCRALHCYRCRVINGHPSETCEQYGAQRGPEFVCKCPGCGVYVVKGDGCDSITCICGRNFCWSTLVKKRERMVVNAFRDAHPDDPGRAAVQIIRRGLFSAADAAAADAATADEQEGGRDEASRVHTGEQQPSTVALAETAQPPREEEQEWAPETAEQGWEPEEPFEELVQELVEELVPITGIAPFEGTGQRPVVPEGQEAQWDPPMSGEGPLSMEDEYRMASTYMATYPREAVEARATMFAEENQHFTVQRAQVQLDQETWRRRAPVSMSYFGRPRNSSVPAVSEAEAEWQAAAARDWLNQNRAEVQLVRQRTELARSALVEAFYGDDTRLAYNTAIAHTAAEHARAALRVVPPLACNAASRSLLNGDGRQPRRGAYGENQEGDEEPLFGWLGIVEPHPPVVTPRGVAESSTDGSDDPGDYEADEEVETWEAPFAEAEIEEGVAQTIPAPLALWRPWPVDRRAPAHPPLYFGRHKPVVADPASRKVSALSVFGTMHLRKEVERWIASSTARQGRLRRVMAVEENELSKAWVALWGRRLRLDPSTRTWVDANEDETAAVCTAARRVIFLQAHPEQACAEQRAMMKAFVRRNKAAIASAGEEATTELAAGWERQHAATPSGGTSDAARTFDRAYTAYLNHVETRALQALSAALAACSTFATPRPTNVTTLGLRRADRMAEAWESRNHKRVCARRFADTFARTTTASGSDQEAKREGVCHEAGAPTTWNDSTNVLAAVAVVALYVAPMILGRSCQMFYMDMEGVINDATDWASFHAEAFDREVERVKMRVAATTMAERDAGDEQHQGGFVMGRALEGCECGREGSSQSSSSCSRLVACPVVIRRILKLSDPFCSECELADGFLGGDLFDLFE